jgi:Na+-transporting NADH:ubiquinone oxidoreductase subunit C
MNKYLRMIGFTSLLGVVSSGLLMTAQLITADRIQANADALLKSEILTAHGVEFTFANIHTVFEDTTSTIKVENVTYGNRSLDLTFYEDIASGRVTFGFGPQFGGGVWGPIIGLLSLDQDFTTIVRISVLQQEETPGLGGIVATRAYLDLFNGKSIGLNGQRLEIIKDLDMTIADNFEVRTITGATRTSDAFEAILNNAYFLHLEQWNSRGGVL